MNSKRLSCSHWLLGYVYFFICPREKTHSPDPQKKVISQDIYNLNFDALTGMRTTGFTVGGILQLFCKGFEGEIRARHDTPFILQEKTIYDNFSFRPYFYKAGTLVREGIIRLSEKWGDLMNVRVELDRRMLDFIVGLDTEFTGMLLQLLFGEFNSLTKFLRPVFEQKWWKVSKSFIVLCICSI